MHCPNCQRSIGSLSKSGEHRVRLRIVLIDPDTQRIHGPCGRCGADVTLHDGSHLAKALTEQPKPVRPGLRLRG
jgi:hypothetical protein